MGLGCEDSWNKLRLLKVLLLTSLVLVALQYALNLFIYRYTSQHLGYDLFRRLAEAERVALSPSHRISEIFGHKTRTGTPGSNASWVLGSLNVSVVPGPLNGSLVATLLNATNSTSANSSLPACPLIPPNLVGALATFPESLPWDELNKFHTDIKNGGQFWPTTCHARHRVAVVIPYRNREVHLRILLHNLHAMLPRQQLHYRILVVELAQPTKFNRALLMNVGFLEGLKLEPFQCFVFHDVDLLPENDRNLYTCPESPRHMSVAIDKFKYRLPYNTIFGGVSTLTKEQMEKVNGFSNKYFGWGGEDDDMYMRIEKNGLKVIRYPVEIARYKMIKHQRERTNDVNPERFKLLRSAEKRMKMDGLNNLTYKVEKIKEFPLYTWILVSVDMDTIMKT